MKSLRFGRFSNWALSSFVCCMYCENFIWNISQAHEEHKSNTHTHAHEHVNFRSLNSFPQFILCEHKGCPVRHGCHAAIVIRITTQRALFHPKCLSSIRLPVSFCPPPAQQWPLWTRTTHYHRRHIALSSFRWLFCHAFVVYAPHKQDGWQHAIKYVHSEAECLQFVSTTISNKYNGYTPRYMCDTSGPEQGADSILHIFLRTTQHTFRLYSLFGGPTTTAEAANRVQLRRIWVCECENQTKCAHLKVTKLFPY